MSDHLLIDAVESGEALRVRGALKAGAHPDTRKECTFSWNVFPKKEGDDNGNTVGVGVPEVKTETHPGESALTLAILSGRADIVELLLLAGANVHVAADWPISAPVENVWAFSNWEDYHCVTFSYPTALGLAIGKGGKTRWNSGGHRPDWGNEMDRGSVRVNKKGARVHVDTPKSEPDTCAILTFTPSLEIVSLLLRHGARVTDVALRAAGQLDDSRFSSLLVHHQELLVKEVLAQHEAAIKAMPGRRPVIPTPAAATREVPLSERGKDDAGTTPASATPASASNPELESWLAKLESRILSLESSIASLQTSAADSRAAHTSLLDAHKAVTADLDSTKFDARAMRALVGELSREVAALRERVG
ncbi:hypothetical protein M427DRAFT_63599 [Gonapodya prolifera JEL478]|uniref:Uncharacterized protein n=1 Tax=Gonapodya prolifera (strain JEL478) TaxID=1344416 RepID=A0A138ZYX6_GONPJ|nr:hypothetical protein M427DRAFT_63599 [Gonapodya prolifera JEL478]|eukprot:KXS09700.1 hypothetical protein M427DRAFT_63599 [Gonapodya prolifera JEL478]